MLRAVTLDYWDTIYDGVSLPERVERRQDALRSMLTSLGHELSHEAFIELYRASGAEAHRWWRDEHRGYATADRIRWLLAQLAIERPAACAHIAAAVDAVDQTLVDLPPALLAGARRAIAALAEHVPLAIISDTGFASGRAQNRVLENDGLLRHFRTTVYSMDIGHAKPRPEPFDSALAALGVTPQEAIHIGDIERTDVAGALGAGMRAIRLDQVRASGPTAAEYVATSLADAIAYLRERGELDGDRRR